MMVASVTCAAAYIVSFRFTSSSWTEAWAFLILCFVDFSSRNLFKFWSGNGVVLPGFVPPSHSSSHCWSNSNHTHARDHGPPWMSAPLCGSTHRHVHGSVHIAVPCTHRTRNRLACSADNANSRQNSGPPWRIYPFGSSRCRPVRPLYLSIFYSIQRCLWNFDWLTVRHYSPNDPRYHRIASIPPSSSAGVHQTLAASVAREHWPVHRSRFHWVLPTSPCHKTSKCHSPPPATNQDG